MAKKYALLIANSEYRDNEIPNLVTPLKNLEMFRSVLEDPDIGGIDPSDITALENQPMGEVRKAVSDFFSNRLPGDFLLLYFTGHGFRGDDNLYLAVSDTEKETISATGISDSFINGEIRKCRAKQQVVILDCCYSGFFSIARESHPISTVVVLTASDRTEFAWEKGGGDESVNSLYTHYLVQGLKTGEPDRDGDGWITVSELHRYLCDKLETSEQNPLKIVPFSREATDIRIAKNLVALVNDARKRELNIRAHIIQAMASMTPEKVQEYVLSSLTDQYYKVRQSAAWSLGTLGIEKAVEPLVKALDDQDSSVRRSAADALGKIGSERALEPLINAFGDQDSDVRNSAADALVKIGSEKTLEPLISALGDQDSDVRIFAAYVLGKIGNKKALEPLISALGDQDSDVRSSAADALGKIGSEKVLEPLISALGDQDSYVRLTL
ncbi:MAG: hypothetical protein GY749_30085 [Desulfobacteraceae bacterium]|nr:hypothetical protein [Desulfobacteraceae bacterium]